MAQGLFQSHNENREVEDIGEHYINELRSLSFFEDVEDLGVFLKFKMHDLVHDLALLVAQPEYCMINSTTYNIFKRVRHVSFFGNDLFMDGVPGFLLDLKNLRTILFLVGGVGPNSNSFWKTCISRFQYLRVLDWRASDMEVLPSCIENLKLLTYLDLSYNCTIKKLPNSICKLQNCVL